MKTLPLWLVTITLAVLLSGSAQAQAPPSPSMKDADVVDTTRSPNAAKDQVLPQRPFHPYRFALVTGSLGAANVGLYFWEKNRWWRKKFKTPFHIHDDWRYAQGLDKIAHAYASGVQALLYKRSLQWSGLRPWPATLTGAGLAWLVQLHVEYQDGFNQRWGFDRLDVAANTLGAAWFVAHEHVDFLKHFNVRVGYFPSKEWREGLNDRKVTFADDYAGHSYWLSADMEELVPALRFWPAWLDLSSGLSLNDWSDKRPHSGYRSYYLSVDLDFQEIIPRSTWLGRTFGDLLSRAHLPFPAVRLYPDPRVHLIFYGQ